MTHATKSLSVRVSESLGSVDALLVRPDDAKWLLVLSHGAGAGMQHPFMERVAAELAVCRIGTLRYQFPYVQQGRKRPDPPAILTATVRAALTAALEAARDLPLLAGGKSLGGRMTALACAEPSGVTTSVRGLIFFGFPLHPAGRPGIQRAEPLALVQMPMLFLQGTRDQLADLTLLRPVCADLVPRATLHVVESADHSFHVQRRSGKTDAMVLTELAHTVSLWADALS